jgi:two-component system nitrate/nitrite response regulator NarL
MPDARSGRSPSGKRRHRPRVLVVDDHARVLEHTARVLEGEFTVVACLRDAESLLSAWPEARPDVVVLDVSLAAGNGFDAAVQLRAAGCGAAIVFLSVHEAREFVRAGWDAGASAYVAKRDVNRALVPAIRAALRGRRYVSGAIADQERH